MSLTLVVPLRVKADQRRDLRRLARLLATTPPEGAIVVSDDTPDPEAAQRVGKLVNGRAGARHVHNPRQNDGPFSIGRQRDLGAQAATDGLIMFHDVDFHAPMAVYRRLASHAHEVLERGGPGAFFCVPVFFLTPVGSAAYDVAPARFLSAMLATGERPKRLLADRVVLGSSAIVLTRETLISSGGHDDAFIGHGAEDFDLMHRLSLRYGIGPRPIDYHADYGSRAAQRGGFRSYFARYGRSALDHGLALVHRWHPPRRTDARYHAARAANFNRLRETLRAANDH
jgi:predicted glycosyltransferase involved in capsule biosynthesis